jgi:hypothetical protein
MIDELVAELLAAAADEESRRAMWTFESEDIYRRIMAAIAMAERQERRWVH